jgi:hypothetical protein
MELATCGLPVFKKFNIGVFSILDFGLGMFGFLRLIFGRGVVLEFKLKTSSLLDRCSTLEPCP